MVENRVEDMRKIIDKIEDSQKDKDLVTRTTLGPGFENEGTVLNSSEPNDLDEEE